MTTNDCKVSFIVNDDTVKYLVNISSPKQPVRPGSLVGWNHEVDSEELSECYLGIVISVTLNTDNLKPHVKRYNRASVLWSFRSEKESY